MADANRNVLPMDRQPDTQGPYGVVTGLSDVALLTIRVAERASILSGDILLAVRGHEAYETIVRRVETLRAFP